MPVVTLTLGSYPNALAGPDYEHNPINVKRSGLKAHQLLPGVHRLFSLAKRWLEGTHQGAVEPDHLQAYLDEFISFGSTGATPSAAACCSSD